MTTTFRWFAFFLVCVCVALACVACGSDDPACPSTAQEASLYVLDAETQEPLCDAEIELRDGDYTETIRSEPGECTGIYTLPARPGEYTVIVIISDYTILATGVALAENSCGVLRVDQPGPRDGLPGFPNTVTLGMNKL